MEGEVIYIVACTQQKVKVDRPVVAAELYMASDWFRRARSAAERHGTRWYIASARYGLVHPEERIESYNEYLGDMPRRPNYGRDGFALGFFRDEWAATVVDELLEQGGAGAEVVVIAGRTYADALVPELEAAGFVVQSPVAGLRRADQLAYLDRLNS